MKAAIYDGTPVLSVQDIPVKRPAPDEILLRVDSANICGTDLHILDGKFEAKPPVVLCHEFAGYIEEMGEQVSGHKIGDLVSVEPHIYCGLCKPCRIGKPHLCLDRQAWGINRNGGFAEYTTVRQDLAYRVPEGVSGESASLGEVLGCVMNGIERSQLQIGESVLIIGGGAAGVLFGQLAMSRGAAKVVFSEPSARRREVIRQFGFDDVLDPTEVDLKAEILKRTGGLGVDVAIDAAGRPETAAQAVELVCHAGRVVYFGVVAPGARIEIEPNLVYMRELSILGAVRNPFTHLRILEMMPRLNLEPIITHRFGLDDINEAMATARSGEGLKISLKPNG